MAEQANKTLKDTRAIRWMVLLLTSGLMFGTYWFNDFLGPLKQVFESELGMTSSDFGSLLWFTSLANLVGMVIIGGILLDKWGIRKAGILFSVIATSGAFLMYFGASGAFGKDTSTIFWVLVVGRILFGTGLETVCVMVSRTVVKWFKGYELALAMAISVAFGRLGSAGANFFGLDIAGGSVSGGVVFAASLIGFGSMMFLVYMFFDAKLDKQLQSGAPQSVEDQFRFSDLTRLATNRTFIYITLLCTAFYSAVFPFIQYAPDLLVNKFGFSLNMPDTSNMGLFDYLAATFTNGPKVNSLIPIGTILFTPIFGNLVDRKGKSASLMMLGSILLIFAFLSLSIFDVVALGYMGLLSLGIAFSLVPAAMWPSVAKIVPESRLGTAYASMFTIQNWGFSGFNWGIGKVLDLTNPEAVSKIQAARQTLLDQGVAPDVIAQKMEQMRAAGELPMYDYTVPILMLVGLGVVSIFLAYQLKRADKSQGYGLELPSGQEGSAASE